VSGYGIAGRRVRRGLGSFPLVTLDEARSKAAELRKAAIVGTDLRSEQRQQDLAATTFRDMFEISFAQRHHAHRIFGLDRLVKPLRKQFRLIAVTPLNKWRHASPRLQSRDHTMLRRLTTHRSEFSHGLIQKPPFPAMAGDELLSADGVR